MFSLAPITQTQRKALVWCLYIIGMLPAVVLFVMGATDNLGADPVKYFEHSLGLWSIRFLILTLLVTPIRDLFYISLIPYRRALGLLSFYYAGLHILTYIVLDQAMNIAVVWQDILIRPFITLGMIAFLALVPLAITSTDGWIKKLGRNWNKLHKLTYIIAALAVLHYVMSVKVIGSEEVIYIAIVAILLAYRPLRKPIVRWRRN